MIKNPFHKILWNSSVHSTFVFNTDRRTDRHDEDSSFSPIDLWTCLKTCQSNQGAVGVSNQLPPKCKLTPNSSDLLRTELRVIPTSAFIGNSKTSWTVLKWWVLSYSRWFTVVREPIPRNAVGELMSARTAGTTVICLGDMCWIIREFDTKPWRELKNRSVQEWRNCHYENTCSPGSKFRTNVSRDWWPNWRKSKSDGREQRRYRAARS